MAKTTDRWTPEGKRFMREIEYLKRLIVKVGFQDGEHENDGVRVVDVAAWNELGTEMKGKPHTPSRPFMRDSIDKHQEEITVFCQSKVKRLLKGASARDILVAIGAMQKGMMQNEITEGDFVPNAPATIRRKGSDKPLIGRGNRLCQSIHFIIRPKGGD